MIIDQLPEILSVDDEDEFAIERGTTTYKSPVSTLRAAFTSDSLPEEDGTAAAGTSANFSRADHVHPSDTSKQDAITANGILKCNGSTVSAAAKGLDFGSWVMQFTLAAADWSGTDLTLSEATIQTTYAYIVAPAASSKADYQAAGIYADDVSTTGKMEFHCTTPPSTDLTVNIVRLVALGIGKTVNV